MGTQVNKWQEEEDRAQRRLQEAVTRCKDDAVTPPGAQNMFTGSSKGAQVNNSKPGGSAFATTVTVEVDDEVAADAELDLEPEPAPAEVAADPPPPPQAGGCLIWLRLELLSLARELCLCLRRGDARKASS